MIELGQAPIIQVPKQSFGFLSMSELAGQNFPQAFASKLKQYSTEFLKKTVDGEFYFNNNGLAQGSNPLILTLMNQRNLFPKEEHLLSIAEFGQAFNESPEAFKETYQDTGICARTKNSYISRNLIKQIRKRGITPTPEEPVVISLIDLKLKQDKRSPYGFIFTLTEGANLIIAPEYGTKKAVTKFTLYDKRGISIPDEGGDKKIWKRDSGVSRVYSDCGQGAGSYNGRLAGSDASGRVVVGKSNVPQEFAKIEKVVAEAEQRKKTVKKNLETRIANL